MTTTFTKTTDTIPTAQPARSKKPSLAWLLLRQLLNPRSLWRIIKLERSNRRQATVVEDSQLKFYSEFLPSGFLHYGYFDDPSIPAEQISLADLTQAQNRYAEKLLGLLGEPDQPVLDAGCGMGGLLPLLEARGFQAAALTPDRNQAAWVRKHYPHIPLHQSRFEKLSPEPHLQHFGTVITSESFQYMNLDQSLALMKKILRPGGRWIICDYFRLDASSRTSGHLWSDFLEGIRKHELRLVHEEDITANILPTLRFANLLAERVVVPVRNLAVNKLSIKHPGYRLAANDLIEELDSRLNKAQSGIDPVKFQQNKQYLLLALES